MEGEVEADEYVHAGRRGIWWLRSDLTKVEKTL